ncbi:MAG: glycosyltransferase family 4 protein [Solirubrobacteraceae bacterium]
MILLLHNRYRVRGGEEQAVEDLRWLIETELGERVEVLERDSAALSSRAAAGALLRGGADPDQVASAVRRTGARVVHAHNLNPAFGWRALAAARAAGARTVLHLHNYRLVCANGICFTRGRDCVRCHGRNTAPGVALNCRGGSRAEAAVYGAALAGWQERVVAHVDRFVVPSAFALRRLRELGAPVADATVIPSVQRAFAPSSRAADGGFVLFAGRVALEKGVFDAIDACAAAGLPLVIAGDGPELEAVRAFGADARGRLDGAALADLRARAAVAIVPSRYEEILPLAALEAMAAGLPVVATRSGGLAELVPEEGLTDVAGLAARLTALWRDAAAGDRALARVRDRCAPPAVAARLREAYTAA